MNTKEPTDVLVKIAEGRRAMDEAQGLAPGDSPDISTWVPIDEALHAAQEFIEKLMVSDG